MFFDSFRHQKQLKEVKISQFTCQDISRDWGLIRSTATDVLEEYGIVSTVRKRVPLKGTSLCFVLCSKYSANRIRAEIKEKNESFGTSLLLANIGPNSPNTPKIVDGSFAALFDTDDVVVDFSKKLKTMHRDIHTNCKSKYLQNICLVV